jgi:hypothetical protein
MKLYRFKKKKKQLKDTSLQYYVTCTYSFTAILLANAGIYWEYLLRRLPSFVSTLRMRLQSQFFMVVVILMCWSIWNSRNDLIFKNIRPQVQVCKGNFINEIKLVVHRVKPSLLPSFELWLQNLIASL